MNVLNEIGSRYDNLNGDEDEIEYELQLKREQLLAADEDCLDDNDITWSDLYDL